MKGVSIGGSSIRGSTGAVNLDLKVNRTRKQQTFKNPDEEELVLIEEGNEAYMSQDGRRSGPKSASQHHSFRNANSRFERDSEPS